MKDIHNLFWFFCGKLSKFLLPRLLYSASFALHGRDFGQLAILTALTMMQGELSPNEVVRLRDHLNGVVEDLKQRLERGESDLREKWRREGERLRERQEEEKKGIYTRQERDMAELRCCTVNLSVFYLLLYVY